jgi:hypothetical protein
MNFIKILLTSCSLLGGNFGGDVAPNLNYSRLNSEDSALECQKMGHDHNDFICVFEVPDTTNRSKDAKKKSKVVFGLFKMAEISPEISILTSENKSKIFHIVKNQVIYHERTLTKELSSEKMCSGRVLEQK